MTEIPESVKKLRCERCFSETEANRSPNWANDEDKDYTIYGIDCSDCPYTGAVTVENSEIVEFSGDIFPTNWSHSESRSHHGYREEPNVLYREHYKVTDELPDITEEIDSGNVFDVIQFTHDEVLNGYEPTVTYDCECGFSSESKHKLAKHLVVVQHNRGENAV